jgi:hypothetical protein
MYNSQNGSYETVNSNICQTCGSLTMEATTSNNKLGIVYAGFGWLFFIISLVFMPIIFGAAALLMGFLTYHDRNQVHGMILMFFAAVGLIVGSLFSIVVAGTMFF